MAPEFLLGPPTPAQLARSGAILFLDFKLLPSVVGGPALAVIACLATALLFVRNDQQKRFVMALAGSLSGRR